MLCSTTGRLNLRPPLVPPCSWRLGKCDQMEEYERGINEAGSYDYLGCFKDGAPRVCSAQDIGNATKT